MTTQFDRFEHKAINTLRSRTSSNFSRRVADRLEYTESPEEFVQTLIEAIVHLDSENMQLVREKIEYETKRETPRSIFIEDGITVS